MKIFFTCKSKDAELNLHDQEIFEYEYENYNSKIKLNAQTLSFEAISIIRQWAYEKNENISFYRYVNFGVIFNETIIKEIIFSDAYITHYKEQFDCYLKVTHIFLSISQKEDKLNFVEIYPRLESENKQHINDLSCKVEEKFDMFNLIEEYQEEEYQEEEYQEEYQEEKYQEEEYQEEYVVLFEKKLLKQRNIPQKYKDIIIKKFSNAPKIVQRIFLKYVPDDSVEHMDMSEQNITQYLVRQKYIIMDFNLDLVDPRGSGIAYFHEHGHLIDMMKIDAQRKGKTIFSNDEEFSRSLKRDFDNYIRRYMEKNNVEEQQAYEEISKIITPHEYDIVSDLFGGITKGKCQGSYGHNLSNWERLNGLEQEAVAHFFELQFDQNRLKITQKFFPDSIKRFEVLLKVLDKSC